MFAPATARGERIRVAIVDVAFENVEALDGAARRRSFARGAPGRSRRRDVDSRARSRHDDGGRRAARKRPTRTSVCSRSPASRRRAPVSRARGSRGGGRGRGRRLARRRRAHRHERRRLGDAGLSRATCCARRRAAGAAAAAPRSSARSAIRRATTSRQEDSAVLGADDLASQPWVQAIAACDERGRWYRTYAGYGGRRRRDLQPPRVRPSRWRRSGEPRRWSEHIAADDSSQASALAAAAAARVLAANRDLSAVGAARAAGADRRRPRRRRRRPRSGRRRVRRPRSARSQLQARSRRRQRARRAAWAPPIRSAWRCSRRVRCPMPSPRAGGRAGFALARAWRAALAREARRPGGDAARAYLSVAPLVSRLFLTSLSVQQAFGWLARHVRALCDGADLGAWMSPGSRRARTADPVRARNRARCAGARRTSRDDRVTKAGGGDRGRRAPAPPSVPSWQPPWHLLLWRAMADRGSLVPALPRAALTTIIVVGLGLAAVAATASMERAPFVRPPVPRPVHRSPR